ncbi:MAG TPA: head GIN domain-containing protein [Flavisolibacter sp.]|nr:head GIN domain-containing protein [Flavisolibacter sp.]
MRKIMFASIAALGLAGTADAQGRNKKTLEGNGKLVTKEISVSSFSALKASGVYELRLSQGSKESVRIEADENLQEYFTVSNEGNVLVINTKKLNDVSLKTKNKMKVYVTFNKLKELELSTVGNVACDQQLAFDNLHLKNKSVGNVDLKLTASKLDLHNSSVGNVKLNGKAQDAVVKNSGVGSLDAGSFVVETMNIDNSGVGNAEVNAQKNLKVKDSFLSKVKNKGAAPVRKMNKVRV